MHKKLVATLAAILMTLGLVQPATAQPGNIVVFGDSYTASPDTFFNASHNSSRGSSGISSGSSIAPDDYPQKAGCLQAPTNWPRQMAWQTGRDVIDWSCTAMTSQSALVRMDRAIQSGELNAGTAVVYLAYGGNDFGPFAWREGAPFLNVPVLRERYARNIQAAVNKIRSVAPHARIAVAGMPEVTNGHGLCLFQVIPQTPLGIPVPGHLAETTIRDMQAYGAHQAGITFVDNYSLTRGHNTCTTNDRERYVTGWVDTTSGNAPMMLHPTDAGHAALARNNAAAMGL